MLARLFVMVRAVIVSFLFIAFWLWLVPSWLAARRGAELSPDRPWALLIMIAAAPIPLRCIWDFAWAGLGTPAPFDPPRRLVVRGFYRWVRNPMYFGFGIVMIGEALLFPAITRDMLILIPIVWILTTLLVITYEEPTLRRLFGGDYEEYCKHVRRWIPRLRPYASA